MEEQIVKQEVSKGYDSLLQSVMRDCKEGQDCFNCDGCNHKFYRYEQKKEDTSKHCYHVSKCGHKYCDKFKWIIDRAKHYQEKTGIDWKDILKGWEEQRTYWYENFYQECNQPEIKTDNVIVVKNREEFFSKYPSKKFICPYCKGITTDPNSCNSGVKVKLLNGKGKEEICNWCSGGLFGTLDGGVHVFLKDDLRLILIFKPIELSEEVKQEAMQSEARHSSQA